MGQASGNHVCVSLLPTALMGRCVSSLFCRCAPRLFPVSPQQSGGAVVQGLESHRPSCFLASVFSSGNGDLTEL